MEDKSVGIEAYAEFNSEDMLNVSRILHRLQEKHDEMQAIVSEAPDKYKAVMEDLVGDIRFMKGEIKLCLDELNIARLLKGRKRG